MASTDAKFDAARDNEIIDVTESLDYSGYLPFRSSLAARRTWWEKDGKIKFMVAAAPVKFFRSVRDGVWFVYTRTTRTEVWLEIDQSFFMGYAMKFKKGPRESSTSSRMMLPMAVSGTNFVMTWLMSLSTDLTKFLAGTRCSTQCKHPTVLSNWACSGFYFQGEAEPHAGLR